MVISSARPASKTAAKSSLRANQHPLIRELANSIEAIWQSHLDLSPYPIPEDLGYVEGMLQGERLVIENHCYQAPQFRKLHLELARVSDRLHILHCVMFPRLTYDLPIFGTDLVGQTQGIGAAIADLSPVKFEQSPDHPHPSRNLPPNYHLALSQLPTLTFLKPRTLPDWGDIFSDFCLFVAPQTPAEEQQFLERVQALLSLHCRFAAAATPLSSAQTLASVRAGHQSYCNKQRQNDKTRRVLEMSFGQDWAERYMRTMLFDDAA